MNNIRNLLGTEKINFQFDSKTGKIYNQNSALYSSSYNELNIIFKNISDEYNTAYNNYKNISYTKKVINDEYYGG